MPTLMPQLPTAYSRLNTDQGTPGWVINAAPYV
eukprot:CAMPEP_0202815976 /NCGR_PEP_ID=MMETSP1389-20130828/6630_1 /ASSEMBLY_ACC=CAM_ASM_000865 /TAXON_ID=302021 /ORGANISM="Rhodomonas sp., Strain CCMP768" /LENGTH=32 /DNA_ID= /DNA_START= /DNA_END= /DNA_ORIENTATION=